jgi:hypothetical protein
MPKTEFQQRIEVRVNKTTSFGIQSSTTPQLRPTDLKRLPNPPATGADPLSLVPSMKHFPGADVTFSGSVNSMQTAVPVQGREVRRGYRRR